MTSSSSTWNYIPPNDASGISRKSFTWAQKAKRHPKATGYWPHAMMAAPLAHLGRIEEAKSEVQEMLVVVPTMTISQLGETYPTSQPGGLEPYLHGLRLTGLPE